MPGGLVRVRFRHRDEGRSGGVRSGPGKCHDKEDAEQQIRHCGLRVRPRDASLPQDVSERRRHWTHQNPPSRHARVACSTTR